MAWRAVLRTLWEDESLHPAVDGLRSRLLDNLLVGFILVGWPAIGLGAWSSWQAGMPGFALAYALIYGLFTAAVVLTRGRSVEVRGGILIVSGMALAMVIMARLGLSGAGYQMLIAFVVLATVFFGARLGLTVWAIGLASTVVVGAGMISGVIAIDDRQLATSRNAYLWVNSGVVFTLLALSLALVPRALLRRLARAMTEQEEQAAILAQANEALRREMAAREKAEGRLLQASKLEAVGTLAGGIAHDFNNLLTGIRGHSALMAMDLPLGHPHQEHLKTIAAQVESAARLTAQLLGFARGGRYEPRVIALAPMVREVTELFGRTHRELTLSLELGAERWAVLADRSQLEQVLLNLLVNAWQAQPTGTVTVALATVERSTAADPAASTGEVRWARISVTDQGPGMSAAVQARIFEPFFTTRAAQGGTGLGLASAYGIVKAHGGELRVHSREGAGARFEVDLPLSDREPDELAPPVAVAPGAAAQILVVDDEPLVREVTAAVLRKLGHRVVTAESGAAALALVEGQASGPDLVLLDMVMPGLGGVDTFHRLRALRPELPVLLLSGYSLSEEASQLLASGCRGFVQKPFTPETLAARVAEVLGRPAQGSQSVLQRGSAGS